VRERDRPCLSSKRERHRETERERERERERENGVTACVFFCLKVARP